MRQERSAESGKSRLRRFGSPSSEMRRLDSAFAFLFFTGASLCRQLKPHPTAGWPACFKLGAQRKNPPVRTSNENKRSTSQNVNPKFLVLTHPA